MTVSSWPGLNRDSLFDLQVRDQSTLGLLATAGLLEIFQFERGRESTEQFEPVTRLNSNGSDSDIPLLVFKPFNA
jgi:hypothetical protein